MTTLAEVLAEHRPVHDPHGHINGTVPGSVAVYDCQCGLIYNVTLDECLEHQMWMITSAGLAVIELPEPDRENPRVWRGSFGGMSCYVTKAGAVGTPDGSITVADARADAAALLAAANAAESVTS